MDTLVIGKVEEIVFDPYPFRISKQLQNAGVRDKYPEKSPASIAYVYAVVKVSEVVYGSNAYSGKKIILPYNSYAFRNTRNWTGYSLHHLSPEPEFRNGDTILAWAHRDRDFLLGKTELEFMQTTVASLFLFPINNRRKFNFDEKFSGAASHQDRWKISLKQAVDTRLDKSLKFNNLKNRTSSADCWSLYNFCLTDSSVTYEQLQDHVKADEPKLFNLIYTDAVLSIRFPKWRYSDDRILAFRKLILKLPNDDSAPCLQEHLFREGNFDILEDFFRRCVLGKEFRESKYATMIVERIGELKKAGGKDTRRFDKFVDELLKSDSPVAKFGAENFLRNKANQ